MIISNIANEILVYCVLFLAIRVDAVSMKPDNTKRHSAVEVNADSTSAIVDGLAEKCEYMLTVTTVTEEYFDNLPEGKVFEDCLCKIRKSTLIFHLFGEYRARAITEIVSKIDHLESTTLSATKSCMSQFTELIFFIPLDR